MTKRQFWCAFGIGFCIPVAALIFEANYPAPPAQAQANQTLNEVQRAFVNEACRPMIEDLIKFKARLDAFAADYDNQSSPIATDTNILADGPGDLPRTDAPPLTGQQLATMRTIAGNMSTQLSGATYNAMVRLAVRDLDTILKER